MDTRLQYASTTRCTTRTVANVLSGKHIGTQMFQFGGPTHDKDVLMGIAAECIVKLVAGEISEDDAKSWCDNRVTTL